VALTRQRRLRTSHYSLELAKSATPKDETVINRLLALQHWMKIRIRPTAFASRLL
jgi:hypothetical protein